MAAAKAFLPLFLLLVSLALIPYETQAARYLFEDTREVYTRVLDPRALTPNTNHRGKPYTRPGCRGVYCRPPHGP